MKSFATCFLLVGAVASIAYAYPARSDSKAEPSDDAEFIVVPLEHQRPSYFNHYPSGFDGFDGVLDTDDFPHAGQSQNPIFFPSINPFTWQFSSYLDDVIKRVRDRFAGSWNPFYGGDEFAPSGPGLFPIDIPDVDDAEGGKTNSTSTVKVIDGHKVIINDTYYTKKTDFGTSVFKVRVIDVKPVDEESGEEGGDKSATTTEKSIETGNRSGAPKDGEKADADDGDDEGKKEPTTEAPKRDTELDSSDEEASPADDSLNTIDTNKDKDIDGGKKDVDEVNTESDADASPTTTSAPAA